MKHPYCKLILSVLLCTIPVHAFADTAVWNRLIRQTTKTAENLPIQKTEEAIAQLRKTRAAPEILETELKREGKLSIKLQGPARERAISFEVSRLLKTTLGEGDRALLHDLSKMDLAAQETALVLARGGKTMASSIPDLASRGRIIQGGGPELIVAVGAHGEEAALAAQRLDQAIKSGSLAVPQGLRAATLSDFGNVMMKSGQASWEFWKKYVAPHWKEWAACGALTAYLIYPEDFQNAVGELTERGFEELTKLGGKTVAAAIRGTGKGVGQAGEEIGTAIKTTYGLSAWAVAGVAALFLLVILVSILWARRFLVIPLKRMF